MPFLLCNVDCEPVGLKGSGDWLYEVSSEKDGGAGARGIRYDGSAAGTRGDGYDVRRDNEGVSRGLTDAIEAGREGKSWDSRSEPDVFCRIRGGRACDVGVPLPTAGDPARRAVGTRSSEAVLAATGEPTCSGDGTSSMIVYRATPRLGFVSIWQVVSLCAFVEEQLRQSPAFAVLREKSRRATSTPRL